MRSRRRDPRAHRRAGPLAAACLAALAACGGERPPPLGADARGWDVVVLLLDALPASALGCYGYEHDVSPELDRFAAGAIRCDAAYASASYTLASVSSLFTGTAPATHGVVGLQSNVLRASLPTLAEAMARSGRATAAFSCNPHITESAGFDRGFERFEHYVRDRYDLHAVPEAVEGDVLAWWREAAGRPRFLYVHLLPPHQPYDPPPPHAGLFGADATEREEGFTDYLVELDRSLAATPEQVSRIRARYDAGVHYADAFAGRLLERLGAGGGLDRALVVVLSDHGEAFLEHGRLLHGTTVFTEMTRVPLLVRWPGVEPGVHRGLVRVRDLAATLCEAVDAPWEARAGGSSMLAALLGEDEAAPPALSRSTGTTPAWALRDGTWTLIEHRASESRLLFDRTRDPGEQVDLAAEEPERLEELTRALRERLAADRAAAPPGPRRSVDTYWKEKRALGYVGYGEDDGELGEQEHDGEH